MKRRCPLDEELYPTEKYIPGEPSGWELHIRWHVTELDVEADMYGAIVPDTLDVDAFLDRGVIRPYAPSEG